jgi:hypothetical protein
MRFVSHRCAAGFLMVAIVFCAESSASHPDWGMTPKGWPCLAYNSQHMASPPIASQHLKRIKWTAPVDLAPQYSGSDLLIHYGSPLVTPANTVVFPVKTGATGGFRVEGHAAADGSLIWSLNTGYTLPTHNWVPECAPVLTVQGTVAIPDIGGRVLIRSNADSATATSQDLVFYGLANYNAAVSTYNSRVKINTPIAADHQGNIYFGFQVSGTTPINLPSGIARIGADGTGSFVAVTTASGDSTMVEVPHNCAPALSPDGSSLYIGVRDGSAHGYLLRLDSKTLAQLGRVRCHDPHSGSDAVLTTDSSAAPTVGPDGQVFYGVLESPGNSNNDRGWMLHYDATLTQTLTPGAFGWDDTATVVPRDAVPTYAGSSQYLLFTKYNNYAGLGTGDGINKIAVLDPSASQADPVTGTTVMREVLTIAGITPDPANVGPTSPNPVREWCINSAAVDTLGHAGIAGSEDGKLYRWDFNSNSFTEIVTLTPGIGEAYTPTVIGPDGTVYAINNATLFAVGQ